MRRISLYDRCSYKGRPQGNKERKLECEGWFHCFMQEGYVEDITPVAVVELDDGTVETWPADQTKFDKTKGGKPETTYKETKIVVDADALNDALDKGNECGDQEEGKRPNGQDDRSGRE